MNTSTSTPRCPYRLDGAGTNIHAEAAALRARGAATPAELPGGLTAWTVTHPDLIRRLLTHRDVSKDAHQHWPAYINGEVPSDWPLRVWVDVRNALTAYGSEHTRLRRPLAAAFSPRRVRLLRPQIKAITQALLDDLNATGPDEIVDLRARFAWRLPLLVVNALLGVPEELHDGFRVSIGGLFDTSLTAEEAGAAYSEAYRLLNVLVETKTKEPGDDVTSALIAGHSSGTLSRQELLDSLMLVIGAGHETTVNLLDHAVTNLLTHSAQRALVVSGQASWEQVVEETLRHQAPIANIILRFAARDILDEPTGLTFRAGDAIVINFAAAGRDPEVHGATAADFDVARPTAGEHLAFGHGPHFCPGAPLARLEAVTALPMLFETFPELDLAVEQDVLQPQPSFISNGHQTLPVLLRTSSNS
ncbi:cytochrome P450 [Streptomyces sp. NPDC048508]|uniref:cytochrome P450 family protein n=1 Tax=Streptomyces sp. NPDC048508 TaxID=3365561 RepID=UPI0037233070